VEGRPPPLPHAIVAENFLISDGSETLQKPVQSSARPQCVAGIRVLVEKFGRESRKTFVHLQEVLRTSLMMLRSCAVLM